MPVVRGQGSQRDVVRPITPKCRGVGGGCGVSAKEYCCAQRTQTTFGAPYLTYMFEVVTKIIISAL
jgi:hypothetical protein